MLRWTWQHAFTGRGGVRQEEGDQTAAAAAGGLQSTLMRGGKEKQGTVVEARLCGQHESGAGWPTHTGQHTQATHALPTCPWVHPPALPQRSAGLARAVEEVAA